MVDVANRLSRLGQTADGENKASVPNANRAILDHSGGAGQGATGFQIGVKRNANDRAAGRVDRELALICRNLDIGTRLFMAGGVGNLLPRTVSAAIAVLSPANNMLLRMTAVADGIVRGCTRNLVLVYSDQPGGGLLPMAEGDGALRCVGDNDRERGPKFAPGVEADLPRRFFLRRKQFEWSDPVPRVPRGR